MSELWTVLQRNASELEIRWSVFCSIVLVLAIWRLIKFGLLAHQLFQRNGMYRQERRMAILRVLRYAERSWVLGVFVVVGIAAMLAPEPVREVNREASELAGNLFLSAAIAKLIASVLEEYLEWTFPPPYNVGKKE